MTAHEGVLWALPIAIALSALHLAAPRLRRLPGVPEPVVASFAGGISVAYVFLHLLPDLAEGNESIGEALSDAVEVTPLLDLAIFLVALTGFCVTLGLEKRADVEARRHGGEATAALFRLHLATYSLSNALILYTMPLRLRTGADFAILFSVAIGLHFVLTDRAMTDHYPRRFPRYGHRTLAAALLAGWVAVAVAPPASTVLVSLMAAALAGTILLNVFKEEVPTDRGSSFPAFLTGVLLYAALLVATTAASQ